MAGLTSLCLFFSGFAIAQISCKYDQATVAVNTSAGIVLRPASGAQVWVCPAGSSGVPPTGCSPKSNLVSATGIAINNPVTADSNGNYGFCVAVAGKFLIQVGGTGLTTFSQDRVIVPADPSSAAFGAITGTSLTISGLSVLNGGTLNGTYAGNPILSGSPIFSGTPVFSSNPTFPSPLTFTNPVIFSSTLTANGTSNFKNLEAILFADQYGNGTTTGIAGAITTAGVVNKTNIWVPSSYATTELVPGSVPQWQGPGPGQQPGQGGNSTANILFQDNRYGRYFSMLDPKGDASVLNANYAAAFRWNTNYIAGPSGVSFNNRTNLGINMNPMDGGFNFNNNGYANKEAYANIDARITSFTPGQKYGVASFNTNLSTGDQLAFFGQNACYGGFTAAGDEGCQSIDAEAYQGNIEYTATIASGAATGSTSLTLTPIAGNGTQGSYRFLIDITKISNAGTISAVTFTNGTTPVAITGSGTAFGTSNVNTTLGTAVTAPGAVTVTPAAMTNITTASLLCIADPGAFEHVTPSATTGTTFTATFRYAHPTTAIVAAGGACGNYIELVADRATTATFGSTAVVNTGGNASANGLVVNTLHYIIPMIRSTSGTAADIWLTNPNTGYSTYRGRWTSGGTNTYAIYPGAQVTSVQGATASCVNNSTCGSGNIANVFTLEQNNAAWATSDVVALPLYFSQNVGIGQMIFQNFLPQALTANPAALSIQSYGISQLGDTYLNIFNGTPAALYTAGGGVLQPPYMLSSTGSFKNIIRINTAPTAGIIEDVDATNATRTIYLNELTGQNITHTPATNLFNFGNTGTGAQFSINASNGATQQKEGTAPSAAASNTVCYSDSTAHALECSYNGGTFGVVPLLNRTENFTAPQSMTTFNSVTNCAVNSASPAACGAAPTGAVVVPTTTTTYTVNTTAVTASSRIFLQPISDNTGLPSAPTCATLAVTAVNMVSGRSAGTSFTFSLPSTVGTTCFNYWVVN